MKPGINANKKRLSQKAHGLENNGLASDSQSQVILETVLALAMLVLFLLGAMAILKSANQ